MKHHLPTLLASLFCASLFAQSFTAINSFTAGNTGTDEIHDITTDANGNIYITGSFTDSVDFNPGPGTFYLTTPAGNKPDAFIQKLDANGNFLWAKSFRGTFNDIESGERLLVDDSGNVYLQGRYQRNLFFTTNGYQWPGNSAGIASRPFLTKIDSGGNIKWGMGWSNSGNLTFKDYGLSFDEVGNIYMVGVFGSADSVDFDPDPLSTLYVTHNNGGDCFIVKISNSGKVQKAHGFGGLNADVARTIANDGNGNIYIGGTFSSSLDANFGSGVYPITSQAPSGMDAFLISIDTSFSFNWAYRYGGQEFTPMHTAVGADGNLVNVGYFFGTRDFDPNPTSSFMISSGASNENVYIQKLDTAGNFEWARAFFANNGKSFPESFSSSSINQVLLGGYFEGVVDMHPDPNQTFNLSSNGGDDGFVVMLDSLGNFVAASSFGGTNDDVIAAVNINSTNRLFAGGSFQNTIDIDPTPNTNLVTSSGQEDMLFLELGLCTVQADTVALVACNQFINPADSTVQTTSGFYTANLLAADGCDSTIVFDVTINTIAPTVAQTIDGLVAQTQAQNPSYQWLNCATGQPVPGATGQTFMPTTNGQYAVIVNSGNCADTSACFAINNVAIGENDLANGITVYPNPTTGKLNITSSEKIEKIEVYDVLGREVLTVHHPENEINLSTLQNGVYVIRLQTKKGITVSKVIKR